MNETKPSRNLSIVDKSFSGWKLADKDGNEITIQDGNGEFIIVIHKAEGNHAFVTINGEIIPTVFEPVS